jgi:hypothetical protein
MTLLPFVIHATGLASLPKAPRNSLTTEDPLPSVLELTGDGYVLSIATRLTAVSRETTDDN